MFESWWFRFLHFGVHSSSARQERRRRLRRRWRCKWLGGGSSGCSARSTHRFPRSLHHVLPDNSSPTAFGDRCCWWWCSGPLTVQAPATPPLQPPAPSAAAAFPQAEIGTGPRASAAGGWAESSLPPAQSRVPALHRQPTDFGAQFPSSLRCCSTLHSSKHQLSLARFSLTPDLWSSSFRPSPPTMLCLPARSLAGWLAGSLSPSVFLFLAGPQRALQLAHRNQPQSITRPELY
jgi:hypothetical protein